jgi:FixJ family two-component response regulator
VSRELLVAVIDDDDPFRTALAEMLGSWGHRVNDFASAEQFIAARGEGSYDCIITDIHMPGMSGIDLKRLLTARDLKMPVIMITARAEPELEARAAASGAVCLLRKPFETDALIKCLERVTNF